MWEVSKLTSHLCFLNRYSRIVPIRRKAKGPGGGQFSPNARPKQIIPAVPLTVNDPGRRLTRDELLARYADGERDFPNVDLIGVDLTEENLAGARLPGD